MAADRQRAREASTMLRAAMAAAAAGFARSESRPDLTGRDRLFLAWRAPAG